MRDVSTSNKSSTSSSNSRSSNSVRGVFPAGVGVAVVIAGDVRGKNDLAAVAARLAALALVGALDLMAAGGRV